MRVVRDGVLRIARRLSRGRMCAATPRVRGASGGWGQPDAAAGEQRGDGDCGHDISHGPLAHF
eukprot:1182693-Prymnesium_polylepis.1